MIFRHIPAAVLFTACALSSAVAGAPPAGVAPRPWVPKQAAPAVPSPAPGKLAVTAGGIPDSVRFLPDTTWLIKVGPRITRCSEFSTQYMNAYPENRPGSDSLGRVEFMTTLINRDLLGLTARALNRPLDFTDRITLKDTEERALSDVFYLRCVLANVRITDAEVAEYQALRFHEAHFRHIRFSDLPTAVRVRAALVGGKLKWEDAVRQYALDRPTLKNVNGEMGWLTRYNAGEQLGTTMFRLNPGEISEPVRVAEGGYEIIRMVERRKLAAPLSSLPAQFVKRKIYEYRASVIADSIQGEIRSRIGMVFDTTSVQWAASRFREADEAARGLNPTTMHLSREEPEFPPADTSRVLARWQNGGRFSLGQLMSWFTGMSPLVRPDITFPEGMMSQISGVVLEPYRAVMARERGLDKDPEVIARVESKREKLLVDHMYQDSVGSSGWVSREERRAYYEKHLPDYVTFPAVDYAAFYRYTRAGADSLVKALDSGAKPEDILAADSLRGEKAGSVQHRGSNEHGTYQKVLFEELRPGRSTVVGPDRAGVFGVLHLIRYDPGRQLTFEESQGMIDETLQNMKSEEQLDRWLQRLRRNYPVESRPELVMRIRLVDPSDL